MGRGRERPQRYVPRMAEPPSPPTPAPIRLAVAGAHLTGQPLHHQLTERGAELVATTRTAPTYRLYALATRPPKPALVRVAPTDPGAGSIEVEVWALAPDRFATFVDGVPAPLGIGRVRLVDGTEVAGFICEPAALTDDPPDITHLGGWRAHLASTRRPGPESAADGSTPEP